jgi:hypothetical protein
MTTHPTPEQRQAHIDGWQDIATAPDGADFLAYGSYLYPGDNTETQYIMIAEKTGLRDWPYETAEGQHPANFFTHWQPLPKPPSGFHPTINNSRGE